MGWHTSENGSNIKPPAIDDTSSKAYIIVRKQFEEVPTYDEDHQEIGTHWRYQELFVPRENYEAFQQAETNKADIAYIAMMADIDL